MEMTVDDLNYDIDNVDLEEQMLIQDLEEEFKEEQNIQDLEKEQEENKQQEENDKSFYQSRRVLNTKNLNIDLDINAEDLRPKYIWKSNKDNQLYYGCVVHKIDKDTYIFNCAIKDTSEYKLKKFNLSDIQQIKN